MFPSPFVSKCPSAGGSKPSLFFLGEKCLLLPCLMSVWLQGAFVSITRGGFNLLGAKPDGPFIPWALNQAGVMQSSSLSLWLFWYYSLCSTSTALGFLSASQSWPKHAHSCDKVPYSAPDSVRVSHTDELQKSSRINIPCCCQELPKLK